jgi:hypothetical protein
MTAALSRRSSLGAFMALAVPVSGQAGVPMPMPSNGSDARLVALWDEWQRTFAAQYEAEDIACELDTQANWPKQPPRWETTSEEHGAWKAACEVERERSGLAAAEKRASDLLAHVFQLEDEMTHGDAEGLIGALVRARVLATRVAPGTLPVDVRLAAILESDLERLAKAAGLQTPHSDERVQAKLDFNQTATPLLERWV